MNPEGDINNCSLGEATQNRPRFLNGEQEIHLSLRKSPPCICKSSRSLTIKIDNDTAAAFCRGWKMSQETRLFKLFFNKRHEDEEYLEVDGIVPDDIIPTDNIAVKINPEDLDKHVVFVKVSQDGTFHYELDSSDSEGESSTASTDSDKISILSQKQIDDNLVNSNGCKTNKVEIQEKITYRSPNHSGSITESFKTNVQNRPPVIIMNNANSAPCQSSVPGIDESCAPSVEPIPRPSTPVYPVYLINCPENVVNEIEVNTSMDADVQPDDEECANNILKPLPNNTVENSPNNSQKQLAQVAPFQMSGKLSKRSPRKPKSPKSPVCSVKQDILNDEIRNCYIKIGPGDTAISGDIYHSINWKSVREATRKLLTAFFPREVLATHTLTGKPSPAFRDRNLPTKRQLDSRIVDDIISVVMRKCNVDARTVRSIITLKCADENKMLKMRIAKQRRMQRPKDKENVNKGNMQDE